MTPKIKEILNKLKEKSGKELEEAYFFADKAHKDVLRKNGEPYIRHIEKIFEGLSSVSNNVGILKLGLLHDVHENGNATLGQIEKTFGKKLREQIEVFEDLGNLKYRGSKRHVESFRKLLFVIAKDPDVLLVKFAQRIENLKTISSLSETKQKRIASESLLVYARLADRLGMGKIKSDIEDLSFSILEPEKYKETKKKRDLFLGAGQKRLEKFKRELLEKLAQNSIKPNKIEYRVKHIYSLYKKLEKGKKIEEVYDVLALRIIVPNLDDCYKTLGIIHHEWLAVPNRLKDYISSPKPNGYRSIHTSILLDSDKSMEIQIRTPEMHKEAELGLSAHVVYVESGKRKDGAKSSSSNKWVETLLSWQNQDDKDLEESYKRDFFKDSIFVFTPKGEVVELPEGSTPIDFAYSIHTDVGNHVSGAYINNKYSPIGTKLSHGDMVKIETKEKTSPSEKWLKMANTNFARRKIRHFLRSKS